MRMSYEEACDRGYDGVLPRDGCAQRSKTMNIEENNRSEYPCERVLVDIFQIALDMRAEGFEVRLRSASYDGYDYLEVDVWSELHEDNCFGPSEVNSEIEAIISSYLSHPNNVGQCRYTYSDFECLHRLYDAMFAELKKRKGENHESF